MAQEFYKRNLLIRYGIKPWQAYIITLFKKTEQRVSLKALELNPEAEDDVDIIESVTENLESGDQEELLEEKEEFVPKPMHEHYRYMLKYKAFNAIILHYVEEITKLEEILNIKSQLTLKRVFAAWKGYKSNKYEDVIQMYRLITLGLRVFSAWKFLSKSN